MAPRVLAALRPRMLRLSAERAEDIGLPRSKIILSAKVSAVQDLIAVYAELARRCDYALHLGLTEAGMGSKGIVASSAAMGVLLGGIYVLRSLVITAYFMLPPTPTTTRRSASWKHSAN